MLDTRRNPRDIARFDFLDRPSPLLNQTDVGSDNQRLAERMCVLGSAGAGLESHNPAGNARWIAAAEP
jgi:hypothetical protein